MFEKNSYYIIIEKKIDGKKVLIKDGYFASSKVLPTNNDYVNIRNKVIDNIKNKY